MLSHEHASELNEVQHGFVDSPNLADSLQFVFGTRPELIGVSDWDLVELYLEAETPVEPWGVYGPELTKRELQDAPEGEDEIALAWMDDQHHNPLVFHDQRDMDNDGYI